MRRIFFQKSDITPENNPPEIKLTFPAVNSDIFFSETRSYTFSQKIRTSPSTEKKIPRKLEEGSGEKGPTKTQ